MGAVDLTAALVSIEQHLEMVLTTSGVRGSSDQAVEAIQSFRRELLAGLKEVQALDEELRYRNEQLVVTNTALEMERHRSTDILSLVPDAYVETDVHGVIEEANNECSRLLNAAPDILIGRPLETFVAPKDRRTFRAWLETLVRDDAERGHVFELEPRHGEAFDAHVTATQANFRHRDALRWLIRDISEQVARERTIYDLFGQLDVLVATSELSRVLMSDVQAFDDIVVKLIKLTRYVLPNAVVTVTLFEDGRAVFAQHDASKSDVPDDVAELEARQRELGVGPLVDAWRRCEPVETMSLVDDERWPELHDLGVLTAQHRSIMAMPLVAADNCGGVLTIYEPASDAWDPHERQIVMMVAAQAAFTLTNVRLYRSSEQLVENLRTAMQSRSIIEQAKGVVMARERCDEGQAFEVLRRTSQQLNVKVSEIARRVVERSRT